MFRRAGFKLSWWAWGRMFCGGCSTIACIFTVTRMATALLAHERAAHEHAHRFRWSTLLVGLMRAMVGSAAPLVLTVSQAPNVAVGLGYVALFGTGSMIGMGALSTAIAVPIAISARWLAAANASLQGAVGFYKYAPHHTAVGAACCTAITEALSLDRAGILWTGVVIS